LQFLCVKQQAVVVNPVSELIGKIKERRLELALSLADGYAINIESYHRLVGTYQGLGEALDILDDILTEKDEDL
jgi:hypothetical protein